MNLNKADIERIIEGVLDKLELKVEGESYYTSDRTIKLMLGPNEITRVTFDVNSSKKEDRDY